MVRVASLRKVERKKKKTTNAPQVSERLEKKKKPTRTCPRGNEEVGVGCICLRLVEDSEGLRPSLRGVQGVAAGVASSELVITQEDDAGTGFRLERPGEEARAPSTHGVPVPAADPADPHLGVTRVSSSVGWSILQVVKV